MLFMHKIGGGLIVGIPDEMFEVNKEDSILVDINEDRIILRKVSEKKENED